MREITDNELIYCIRVFLEKKKEKEDITKFSNFPIYASTYYSIGDINSLPEILSKWALKFPPCPGD